MNLGVTAAIVYGVLAIAGGIIGYVKSQSKASIISGSISGLLLILGGVASLQGQVWGLILTAAIAALLIIVFAIRWLKTRKLMPAGVMVLLGAIALALILYQLKIDLP
jgi:uncharacterized membrane protein (UPF0136 family)